MMETTNNTFGQKAGQFALSALEMAGIALQWTVAITALLVLSPFAITYWVIAFNPVSFWVWAMIHPRSAANSCGDRGTKELMAPAHEFLWNLNCKFRRFLPWRSRKVFIWATQFEEGSQEDHLRLFRTEDQLQAEILQNNWLTKEEKAVLWPEIGESLRAIMMPKMGALSQEQISFLIHNGEWNLFQQYIAKYTLSERMLCILLNEATKNSTALYFLCAYIRIHSLPASMINILYKNRLKALLAEVEIALESFRQRSMVKLYASDHSDREKWNRFLDDLGTADLFKENQKLLTVKQYRAYHLKGKKLSEDAIIFFLSQENMEMAKQVLSYEVKNNTLISNNIKSLIASKPELARMLIEA